jgi:peroxidase
VAMRTGRRDSRQSYYAEVERDIPNHNDSVSVALSRFAAMGVDTEGAYSVGRVRCFNLVGRLYPSVDASMDPAYGAYLRAPEDTHDVAYARNDRDTAMLLDNMYYKHLLARKGLLLVYQQLAGDPHTAPFAWPPTTPTSTTPRCSPCPRTARSPETRRRSGATAGSSTLRHE